MVKQVLFGLGVTLIVVSNSAAQSSDAERHRLSSPTKQVGICAGVGVGVLSGPFKYTWVNGPHGLLGMWFNLGAGLQLIPKVEYNRFGLNHDVGRYKGGALSNFLIGVAVTYKLQTPQESSKLSPFLSAGMGTAHLSASDAVRDTLRSRFNSESPTYFEMGGGLNYENRDGRSIFFLLRYVSEATEGATLNYIPFTVGVKF